MMLYYHGLLNMAAGLRRSIPPIINPAKEITFRIDYFCECSLAQIGIEFWSHVFEAMDDQKLRANVRYVCVQDNDAYEETAFTYRYDVCGFGEVPYQDGLDAITDTGNWEFDMYIYGLNEERQEGTPAQKEADRQVVDALNAYSKKYDLSFEPENLTEITVDGYYTCAAAEIPQLLEDIQQMMRFLDEKGYDTCFHCIIGGVFFLLSVFTGLVHFGSKGYSSFRLCQDFFDVEFDRYSALVFL